MMTRSIRLAVVSAVLWAVAVQAQEAAPAQAPVPVRVLTLEDALQTAKGNHPQLKQAHAQTEAALARVGQGRSALFPQVTGTAAYTRQTGNFASSPGSVPKSAGAGSSSWDTYNYFNFGVTAKQLLYDFGQSTKKWTSAEASAKAQENTEQASWLQVTLGVRSAYFTAYASKELLRVAQETLENQEKHLRQIEGFVTVGTRPEIDLAQARTDRANARVQFITAQNNYEVAKAQLNQAIGVEGTTEYDIAGAPIAPLEGETGPTDSLMVEALAARPEFAALTQQIRAQEAVVSSVKGAYGPSLFATTGITDAGQKMDNLAWNWNAGAQLTWPLFQGGQTRAQAAEAESNLAVLRAQADTLRQSVRVEVEQARLAVRAAKEVVVAAGEALDNAKLRLKLAEGRYAAGVGNSIEQGDAQVALTAASAQVVQAEFQLSAARAQLLKALGRV